MANFYIQAYYSDNTEILGTGDGQTALKVSNYRRTLIYKELLKGAFKRPYYWLIVNANGQKIEKIMNNNFKEGV